jgi:hypothetical protein
MRPEQLKHMAHNIIHPSMRRSFVDSLLDRGVQWMRIDHIPWDENPLVIWELDAIKRGKKKCSKSRAHEWRYNGKIYHRDVLNNVWQKSEGKMVWIGIYIPHTNLIDLTANEPK